MIKPTPTEILGAVVFLVFVAAVGIAFAMDAAECSARGGVYVRAFIGYECIDAKALK